MQEPTGWQFLSEKVVANFDYNKITFYLMFYRNANTIQFDNVGLFKEEYGQSYQYDKNGNVISIEDVSKQNSTLQYNGNNELLKQVNPKGGSYVYEYDSKVRSRLLSVTNNSRVTYDLEYDDYGNAVKSTISNQNKISTGIVSGQKYYIRSSGTDKYINVRAAGTVNGTDVTLNILNGNMKHQEWNIYDAGNGYYYLRPGHADNMALTTTNTVVDIQTFTGNDNQKYKFEKNTDGSFVIKSKTQETTHVIAVDKELKENSYYIIQEIFKGEENQKFFFENVETDNSIDETIIESGEVYYLKNKITGFYLDYQNQSDTDETKIVQKSFSGTDSQKWRLIRNENGTYKIIPLFSGQGRTITMAGQIGSETRANFVEMALFDSSAANQQWWIYKQADDSFLIRTNYGGTTKELCISSDSQLEGIETITFEHGGRNTQYWCLEPVNVLEIEDGATYKIKNKNSNLYVGVANNQDINGANIEQVGNQEWIFENLRNGYYKIISKNSQDGKVMEMQNGASTHGTNVQLSSWNGSIGQQWEIVPSSNGEVFYIKPRNAEGRGTLDVQNYGMTVGTNIVMANYNGSTAQQFYLEKISSPTTQYIETNSEYSSDGKYLTKVTDQKGYETKYEYNEATGTISKVIDSKNTETNYIYDYLDRLTNVKKIVGDKTYQNSYTYLNDRLNTITHNGFTYSFIYDDFGNVKQTKVGNQTLATNSYEANNGNLESVTYGNNQQISYGYDRFNRLISETKTQGVYQYTYDAKSNLGYIKSPEGIEKNYTYDLADRLVKVNDTYGFERSYTYDNNSNIDSKKYTFNNITNEIKYIFDKDNRINNIEIDSSKTLTTNYDRLSRINNKELIVGTETYTTEYIYEDLENNKTTTDIKSIKNGTNDTISYTYDTLGNIETITEGTTLKAKYYYDSLNQLIREDNAYLNKTITYEYDLGGNITNKKEYAYTTGILGTVTKTISYTYGNSNWKDQLTNYNGTNIIYDNIGNPLSYGNNTYTWQNGRELYSITNSNSGLEVSYRYDENGIRRAKVVNGVVTRYHTEGNKVIYEKVDGSDNIIYYSYDENGQIIGLKYNDTQYYYIKNIQGDIIGILDNNLQQIVSYTYTSWGELISIKDSNGNEITSQTHIGIINPYRYRSYRYDTETGLYYLQSRYYNPEWGRFINFDNYGGQVGELLSHNGYAYCKNNPVNMMDENGNFSISIVAIFAVIVIAVMVTTIPQETWTDLNQAITTTATGIVESISSGIANITTKKETQINTQTITETTTKNTEEKIVFPINPDDFNPKGLTKVVYPGTKNGKIIKWQIAGITKFEWNEDLKYGSHYHITPLGKHTGIGMTHFKPLEEIPEPYRSIYFY